MIAIDIETLGRNNETPLPPITCICIYNGLTQAKHALRFWKMTPEEVEANLKIVIEELDNADYIAGYSVVLFDLDFIRATFQIPQQQMTSWVLKCIDPFMCAKYLLKNTCKLNDMLAINGLASKTGSGSDAIILAKEEKWEQLLDYCMMDTTLTYELCSLNWIVFSPMLKGKWEPELEKWRFEYRVSNNYFPALSICSQLPTLQIETLSDN